MTAWVVAAAVGTVFVGTALFLGAPVIAVVAGGYIVFELWRAVRKDQRARYREQVWERRDFEAMERCL